MFCRGRLFKHEGPFVFSKNNQMYLQNDRQVFLKRVANVSWPCTEMKKNGFMFANVTFYNDTKFT